MTRSATASRVTSETQIEMQLDLDGEGRAIEVSHGFLAHLLDAFARHARVDLSVKATGDQDEVDVHHLAEDTGIVLGTVVHQALGDRKGIERYGSAFVPMDETLAHVTLDFSGRPYLAFDPSGFEGDALGFNVHHVSEFLRGFVNHAGATLHVRVLAGVEVHHVSEAIIKAFARALRDAVRVTGHDIPSTKGVL